MKITIEVEDSEVLDIIRDVLKILAADETKEEKRKTALQIINIINCFKVEVNPGFKEKG